MKVIIVGLGSMGRRRARLLKTIDKTIQIIGVDTQEERRKQAEGELGISTEDSIESACVNQRPDCAFVSTSPLSHASIIKSLLEKGVHVFTELNLVDDGYDENIELAKLKGKTLFLSSTFLYRDEIQYIKEEVEKCKCHLSYVYHAGQYLPDWHPWESYKNFFIGNKATNGCREFMAIEFPWLIDTFGKVKSMYSSKSKNSNLDIDFPDTYQIFFEHETGHRGLIAIDVVSRKPVRNFELSGEHLYLTWDGTPEGLLKYDYERKESIKVLNHALIERVEGYSPFVVENAYKSEIINFLDVINKKDEPRYSFDMDKYTLSVIDRIERSCL